MTFAAELRQQHLDAVCRALARYVGEDRDARMTTVTDDEALSELARSLSGKSAVVFTIEDHETFQRMVEDETDRVTAAG